MTMDPNPAHWSPDIKALSQLVTLVVTILGSVGGGAVYIGDKIYNFAEAQTELIEQVKNMQGQLVEQKSSIQDENRQRTISLDGLKGDLTPRIDKLETAVHTAENEAAAAHERADDMKKLLDRIEDLAIRNLEVSKSHDADIKATAKAVGADGDQGPPGH